MPHMKTMVAEYAIILNEKNEFLMVKLKNHSWHFPGGRLNECETSITALKREVKEETNLEITNINPIFTRCFDEGENHKYGVFFSARVKEPYTVKISDEHNDFAWFNKNQLSEIHFWQPFYKELLERYFKQLSQ
ncbi:hypothetical protein COV18_00365 [Candidatus Woesearchaeota archaeon CG10_big_fil_rev_8_21_14_0_10_37_12]|nr:MAG: hypothetical protein COV18_00365 [Candidatus Woesearchaeota archaeon CG10_big_fil_rev_8_21_14_0_10_37_12]